MKDELRHRLKSLGRVAAGRAPEITAEEIMERCALRSLEHRPARSRRWLGLGGAATAFFLAGVGTTAAVNSITADQVERGLPGAARIFEGTGPSCVELDDDLYLCSLERPPAPELVGTPANGDEFVDPYPVFVDEHRVVKGGCGAITEDQRRWLCAVGRRAVDYGYVETELLGTELPGVGVG